MNDVLQGLAERLMRDARMRPGTMVAHKFSNGAHVAVRFENSVMRLRITRTGVYPAHDFSVDGPKRERAWDKECETFRRAFGVPDNSTMREDVQTIFYFRIYAWAFESRSGGGSDGNGTSGLDPAGGAGGSLEFFGRAS